MKNKTMRIIMQMLYGKECFINKLGIKIRGVTTLDNTITYHHIRPLSLRRRNNNTKWCITY